MGKGQVALGVLGSATGLGMLGASKDKIIGQKTLYHGTSDENWDRIKKEGLKTSKGGDGGTIDISGINHDRFKNGSKGYMFATADKNKARSYAKISQTASIWTKTQNHKELRRLQEKYKVFDEDSGEYRIKFPDTEEGKLDKKTYWALRKKRLKVDRGVWANPLEQKGKLLKIKIPYNRWKKDFILDPDEKGAEFKGKGRIAEEIGKNIAAKTPHDITKDEIVGLHNPKDRLRKRKEDLPEYIKENPVRFGTGVGLATGGAYLTGKSANTLKNQIKKAKIKQKIMKRVLK